MKAATNGQGAPATESACGRLQWHVRQGRVVGTFTKDEQILKNSAEVRAFAKLITFTSTTKPWIVARSYGSS